MVGRQILALLIGVRVPVSELKQMGDNLSSQKNEAEYPMRINRYLSKNNFCSRREADVFISKGIVRINGKVARLGDKVGEGDSVEFRTRRKAAGIKFRRYFAYCKPVGIMTHSARGEQKDIREISGLSADFFPVGRLDKNSHGLMILTNDGRITDKMLNPEYGREKEYIVRVHKKINNFFMRHMSEGVDLENFRTKPAVVKKIGDYVFRIILTEGKKHQIRRMCAALGYEVTDLERTRVMSIRSNGLKSNQKREIVGDELRIFLNDLGIETSDEGLK